MFDNSVFFERGICTVNVSETIALISSVPLHHLTLEVVPQLMAMAQGGGEEKWNTAQVSPEII